MMSMGIYKAQNYFNLIAYDQTSVFTFHYRIGLYDEVKKAHILHKRPRQRHIPIVDMDVCVMGHASSRTA